VPARSPLDVSSGAQSPPSIAHCRWLPATRTCCSARPNSLVASPRRTLSQFFLKKKQFTKTSPCVLQTLQPRQLLARSWGSTHSSSRLAEQRERGEPPTLEGPLAAPGEPWGLPEAPRSPAPAAARRSHRCRACPHSTVTTPLGPRHPPAETVDLASRVAWEPHAQNAGGARLVRYLVTCLQQDCAADAVAARARHGTEGGADENQRQRRFSPDLLGGVSRSSK